MNCEEDGRSLKELINATSAVRNKYNSRITKKAAQCVIVNGLRVNNREVAANLKAMERNNDLTHPRGIMFAANARGKKEQRQEATSNPDLGVAPSLLETAKGDIFKSETMHLPVASHGRSIQ